MKQNKTPDSEPLSASRKQRKKALTSVKLKRSRVLKVVNNRFQKLGLAAHNENVEMTDDQIAGFIDNQLLEQFPLTQQAFNEFRQARQALTFLSVSEKSLKDMLGLPQYRKDGIQAQEKTDGISDGQ